MYHDKLECHDWDTVGYPGEYVYGDDVYVPDCYLDERWKRIWDFPDYWISTAGRVWSTLSDSFVYGRPVGPCGHIDVELYRRGKKYHRYMHRLVGEAFIPNPHDYPLVRHLDDDPSNNWIWNLAWGTQIHNMQDAIENGRFYFLDENDREKAMQARRMPIVAVRIKTGETLYFDSQQEAARQLGIDQPSIYAVIHHRKNHVRGWYFAKQGEEIGDLSHVDFHRHAKKPPIVAINLNTGEELEFRGLTQAANCLGVSVSSVSMALHGKLTSVKGWAFEYIEEEMWQ